MGYGGKSCELLIGVRMLNLKGCCESTFSMSPRVQPQPKLNDTCTLDLSSQQRALDEMACVCGVNFAPNSLSF